MSTDHKTVAGSLLNEQNSAFVIAINGNCMHPLLASGDKVEVLPSDHYLPGDIVIFEHPLHGLTAHRMLGLTISTKGFRYMTKADNASAIDRMLEPQKVLGRIDKNLSQEVSIRPSLTTRLLCIAQLLKSTISLTVAKLFRR